MQVLQAFADELSFELARVLSSDLASGTHSELEMAARHEIVVCILWRGPVEGLYTLGLHMHNSLHKLCIAESRAAIPAFLSLRFGVAVLHWVSGASVVAFCFHTKRPSEAGHE